MLHACVLIAVLIHHVTSRSTGPPIEACSTLTPQHAENMASNCGQNCPYSLQVVSINGVPIAPLTGTIGYVSATDIFGSTFMHIHYWSYVYTYIYSIIAKTKWLCSCKHVDSCTMCLTYVHAYLYET